MDPSDPRTIWRRTSGDDWGAPEDAALAEKERLKKEWRERGTKLLTHDLEREDGHQDQGLPTPRSLTRDVDLGDPLLDGAAEDDDWDVEAAVERRVVQVMFTVPKGELRVVNADVDRSSLLSIPLDRESEAMDASVARNDLQDATENAHGGRAPAFKIGRAHV